MSWLIYLFGSGLAFFVGAGFILAAAALFTRVSRGWRASLLTILALVGTGVVALSAAPLSYWFYGIAAIVTLGWLIAERCGHSAAEERIDNISPTARKRAALFNRVNLRWATSAVWLGAVLLELPSQFAPRVRALGNPPLYIIGDSITAGAGAGEKHFWPDLLPKSVEVHNFAKVGATAASARTSQIETLPQAGGLILLEIGGNDLLGDTPAAAFERDLDQLLAEIVAPGRTVLMFELPLPPLANEYGRVQRRLARQHGVQLIPKRILMGVLSGDGTTLDSVHHSDAGHQRLASTMWTIVGSAYDTASEPP
jgi:acyl-CoA thioesterase-1